MTNRTKSHESLEQLSLRYAAARRAVEEQGIRIKHLRVQHEALPGVLFVENKGGLTLAYKHDPKNSFVEVSTAICSSQDLYNRKAGTVIAVEGFVEERRIRIPLCGHSPEFILDMVFCPLVTY